MWPERTVDGYLFYSAEDAQLAAQEKKKGEYLDKYLDYHNGENVLKVYKKAIAEHIFKTPVGYDYLRKMQKFLLELGKGFLFEQRQKRFTFNDKNFYVDLVLYNR